MRREDVNEIGLAILAVVAVLLVADNIWLHVKCARQETALVALEERVERHVNPPDSMNLTETARDVYHKVRSAAAKGYKAAKEKLGVDGESK